MRRLFWYLTLLLALIAYTPSVEAATKYISPTGAGLKDGSSAANAWQLWSDAWSGTVCGDTLIVMDGTFTVASNGRASLTKSCTASTFFTIEWENERVALISGDGASGFEFRVTGSSYIRINGMQLRSTDQAGGGPAHALDIRDSHHIELRRLLIHHNDRNDNAHLLGLVNVNDSLVEESEFYFFHRHAGLIAGGQRNVFRRNYCHPRDYADIVGGYPSSDTSTGDDCFVVYIGVNQDNIIENNIAEGDQLKGFAEIAHSTSTGNQFLGNIATGPMFFGMSPEARGTTLAQTPQNTTITDFVAVDTQFGMRVNGTINTICTRCSFINQSSTGAIVQKGQATQEGATPRSYFMYDSLFTGVTGTAFSINTTDIATWSVENSTSNGNGTNWSPSSHANYNNPDTPLTTAPGLGSCYLWAPDASAADTNNWGARILYRYESGILTTIPLWDPTTGEFPHGAIITGINDTASTSAYNVHQRLNVNTGGCSFPASYPGGGTPGGGSEFQSSTGTTSTSHSHTFSSATAGNVWVHLRDGALNVGSVSAVSSSCGGGEAYSFSGGVTSVGGLHRLELWQRASPTDGTCTMSVTTTGQVTSVITTSQQVTGTSGLGTVATNATQGTPSSTPTVTVPTNTSELIWSAVTGYSGTSLTAGANQTLQTDELLAPTRLAISSQSGDDGGVMSYTFGGNTTWTTLAVSMPPTTPDPPPSPTPVQRIQNTRWYDVYGTEASPTALAALNTTLATAHDSSLRLITELKSIDAASVASSMALFCRKNAASYARITNAFGSNVAKFYGGGTDPNIPASYTATTQHLSADTFTAGAVLRDDPSIFVVQSIATNGVTELTWILTLNPAQLTAGDTVNCLVYRDDGTPLDAAVVTPTLSIVESSGSVASLDTIMEKLALLLFGLAEVKTLVSRPQSNFTVDYPDIDTLQISGACDRIRTDGSGNARTMRCLH